MEAQAGGALTASCRIGRVKLGGVSDNKDIQRNHERKQRNKHSGNFNWLKVDNLSEDPVVICDLHDLVFLQKYIHVSADLSNLREIGLDLLLNLDLFLLPPTTGCFLGLSKINRELIFWTDLRL